MKESPESHKKSSKNSDSNLENLSSYWDSDEKYKGPVDLDVILDQMPKEQEDTASSQNVEDDAISSELDESNHDELHEELKSIEPNHLENIMGTSERGFIPSPTPSDYYEDYDLSNTEDESRALYLCKMGTIQCNTKKESKTSKARKLRIKRLTAARKARNFSSSINF